MVLSVIPNCGDQMFRDAERALVDDVGGVFIAHEWAGDLFQPWVQGETIREPDSVGIAGMHWGNDQNMGDLYISNAKSE
ncbi:MAG: hypothetical protein R2854_23935 [Caldilineaceae bacterium]